MSVVVFQPHLDPDLTAIGLDTPDDRRWELDAAIELQSANRKIAERQHDEDE